jgi:hypothetical protein
MKCDVCGQGAMDGLSWLLKSDFLRPINTLINWEPTGKERSIFVDFGVLKWCQTFSAGLKWQLHPQVQYFLNLLSIYCRILNRVFELFKVYQSHLLIRKRSKILWRMWTQFWKGLNTLICGRFCREKDFSTQNLTIILHLPLWIVLIRSDSMCLFAMHMNLGISMPQVIANHLLSLSASH